MMLAQEMPTGGDNQRAVQKVENLESADSEEGTAEITVLAEIAELVEAVAKLAESAHSFKPTGSREESADIGAIGAITTLAETVAKLADGIVSGLYEEMSDRLVYWEPSGPWEDGSDSRATLEAKELIEAIGALVNVAGDEASLDLATKTADRARAHLRTVVRNLSARERARGHKEVWKSIGFQLDMNAEMACEWFGDWSEEPKIRDLEAISEAADLVKDAAALVDAIGEDAFPDLTNEVVGMTGVHLVTLVQSAYLQHDRSWKLIGETLGISSEAADKEFRGRFYQMWIDGQVREPRIVDDEYRLVPLDSDEGEEIPPDDGIYWGRWQ